MDKESRVQLDHRFSARRPALAVTLKGLGVAVTALATAIGSYAAARSKSRSEAETSYEVLARTVERLRISVDYLEENSRRLWVIVQKQATAPVTMPAPAPPRRRGRAAEAVAPVATTAPKPKVPEPPKPLPDLPAVPPTLGAAIQMRMEKPEHLAPPAELFPNVTAPAAVPPGPAK